jgi:hypothetical protein
VITIPASATVGALFYLLVSGYWARVLIAVAVIAVLAWLATIWRSRPRLA